MYLGAMGSQGGTMGAPWVGSLSLLGLKGPLDLLDPWASLDPRASWRPGQAATRPRHGDSCWSQKSGFSIGFSSKSGPSYRPAWVRAPL